MMLETALFGTIEFRLCHLTLRSLPTACLQQAGRDDKVPLCYNTRRQPTMQTLRLSHGGLKKYRDLTGFKNLLGLYRKKNAIVKKDSINCENRNFYVN